MGKWPIQSLKKSIPVHGGDFGYVIAFRATTTDPDRSYPRFPYRVQTGLFGESLQRPPPGVSFSAYWLPSCEN